MSGRDLRNFLSEHRKSFSFTRDNEGLTQRYLRGATAARNKTYHKVDYEHLLCTAKEQKVLGDERLKKVQRLSKRGRESKETSLLRQHHEIWEKERSRLLALRKATQAELEAWRSEILVEGPKDLRNFIAEITEYQSELYEERRQFEADTLEPIWSLRIDLKGWVEDRWGSLQEDGCHADPGSTHQAILRELESVKEQQRRIQELLESEFDLLSSEVKDTEARYIQARIDGDELITRGIPTEALALECPDSELKDSTLKEFLLLDEHFQTSLDHWEEQHREVLCLERGGWSVSDAERFSSVQEQYPPSLAGRRALVIDRLVRELPHKSRTEIVDHESWHRAVTYYHIRRRALLKSWSQHRIELLGKVATVFAESQRGSEARQHARAEREQQLRLCEELYQKVSRWRSERLEALRMEAELAARVRVEEERRRREEEERHKASREKQKAKLQTYHAERAQRRESERAEERRRQEEIRTQRTEQAKRDKERVKYRCGLQAQRAVEEREAEERRREEVRERERRLELLRQQVQVNVSTDPVRVLKDTKASVARVDAHQSTELELQRPLFPLYSYPDEQVTSDLRFRVAAALREVGLHGTTYARRVLAAVPPPVPPRPDQFSSIFKHDS